MSKFRVGDRVRVNDWRWHQGQLKPKTYGIIVGELNGDGCCPTEFPGWRYGHNAGLEDESTSRWFVPEDELEFVFHHPADVKAPIPVFHVIYIEDDDRTFYTQADAEKCARDLAREEPGAKFAVFKRMSVTKTEIEIERYA